MKTILAAKWIDLFYAPINAYNFLYGPRILKYTADETYEIVAEGVTENPNIGGITYTDEAGNKRTVYEGNELMPELDAWTWLCLEHPANGMFQSTLADDYVFAILNGNPTTAEGLNAKDEGIMNDPEVADDTKQWTWTGWRDRLKTSEALRYGLPIVYPTADQQQWIDENLLVLEDYVTTMEAQFISGELDIEENYDDFIAELKRLGAEDYQKIYVDLVK